MCRKCWNRLKTAMRFKLFGAEVCVTFPFSALIAFLLFTDRTGLALPFFAAVLLHETGHLFAMWALDYAPTRIRLSPAAVEITSPPAPLFREEILIALSGPLTNFLLFGTFGLAFRLWGGQACLSFALINALIGAFNLLPVTGLDGGTVLRGIATRLFGVRKARLIMFAAGLFCAALCLAAGVFLFLHGVQNPTPLIMALYFLVATLMKM